MRKSPSILLIHISLAIILAGGIISFFCRRDGQVRLDPGVTVSQWVMGDGTVRELPELMTLQEFVIERYPGSEVHKDYRSVITLGTGSDARPLAISMNHIGKVNGYRFYQSGYDRDSTILMVVRDPWGVGVTYAGYILMLIGMIGFLLWKESGWREALSQRFPLILPSGFLVAVLAALIYFLTRSGSSQPLPVLRSPLLPVHVIPIMISYFLFAAVAVIGIIGLCRKDSAQRLRHLSLAILYPAVFLLAFGTIVGAVWANNSWGSYWSWDPKETWALITLLVYAATLHGSRIKAFRNPRFFHLYCILAILCVLFTYFGVNILLGGMHSYS